MIVERSVAGVRAALAGRGRVALVPTMGSLHEGHLSLIDIARTLADVVVVSIFVNPLQFGPSEDFDSYPRDEDRDLGLLRERGVDLVFVPSTATMYPHGADTIVHVGRIGHDLEGATRPGHFDGVATVVAKLFNIVRPDVAVFGQKDAQQVAVIKKMVADLDMPVEIVVGPIVRAEDGVALSSRNSYLSPEERTAASALWRALQTARRVLEEREDPSAAAGAMRAALETSDGVEVGYAAAVDPFTFGEPQPGGDVLLVVAARLGSTRLIDNLLVERN